MYIHIGTNNKPRSPPTQRGAIKACSWYVATWPCFQKHLPLVLSSALLLLLLFLPCGLLCLLRLRCRQQVGLWLFCFQRFYPCSEHLPEFLAHCTCTRLKQFCYPCLFYIGLFVWTDLSSWTLSPGCYSEESRAQLVFWRCGHSYSAIITRKRDWDEKWWDIFQSRWGEWPQVAFQLKYSFTLWKTQNKKKSLKQKEQ